MRVITKYFYLLSGLILLLAACKKVESLPNYGKGTAVSLTASTNAVSPALADSNKMVVTYNWTSPNYATDTSRYKFLLQIDSATKNFSNPFVKEVVGNRDIGFTGRELNAIALARGYALNKAHNMEVRIVSSYANNNERYTSNAVALSLTPFADPSKLASNTTTVTGSLATQTQTAVTFNWNPSFTGFAGPITYTLQYDVPADNFASPKEIAVGASILSKSLTIGELNQIALDEGIAGGTAGDIQFRIKATTPQGATTFSNAITVNVNTYIPFYNMYLVGDFNGWDAANAPELISDRTPGRWGKVFFSYVRMSAGNKFLFLHKRGAWETKHGATGGSGEVYDIGDQNTGADFQVAATGIYRITIDLDAKKAYVQLKQVGVVGNMQGWNPASPIYGGYLRKDHFLIITPSNNDGFKFHDGPEWNNSTPDKARWYGPAGNGLLTYDGSGSDIIASGNPRSRVIWNGTDPQQLKYEVSPANEMRVVGDGIDEVGVGEWSPGTSPQMTYSGNGVWTITIKLKADKSIKFLAGNDWGAFDYEDAGTGAVVVGTPRAIKWDGGPDFKTPAVAGTYTITLNEHTGTVTISN